MRAEHCSDERLLAYFDGELGAPTRWRTARHLRVCWQCRGRLEELARQAAMLARAARAERLETRAAAMEARQRFLQAVERMHTGMPVSVRPGRWWKLPAAVALGALAMAAGIGVWHRTAGIAERGEPLRPRPEPVQRAKDVAARAVHPPAAAAPRQEMSAPSPTHRIYTPEQLAEAELEAITVLRAHPSPGLAAFSFDRNAEQGLRIAGIAESDSQRRILLNDLDAAVQSAPWSAALRVPEDLAATPQTGPIATLPAVHAHRAPAIPLLLDALRSHMEPREALERANEIATAAVRHAGSAWSSAWTLSRLARRFPDATLPQLSHRGRAILARVASLELRLLRDEIAAEHHLLDPLRAGDSAEAVVDVLPAVERMEKLTHALMSSGDAPPPDVRGALAELLSILGGLDNTLSSGEAAAHLWPSLAREIHMAHMARD